MPEPHARRHERAALLHPLSLGALGLLLLNDHWFKHAQLLPGWLTGKLSDVAGLIVAPIALIALLSLRGPRARTLALGATGIVFAAINVSTGAAGALEALLGWRIWSDPSDLLALPALGLAHLLLEPRARPRRQLERRPRRQLERRPQLRMLLEQATLVIASFACLATSQAPQALGLLPSPGEIQVISRAPEEVMIRSRRLRASVTLDCNRLRLDPSSVLDERLFEPAQRTLLLESEFFSLMGSRECEAALVEETEAGRVLVVWSSADPALRLSLERDDDGSLRWRGSRFEDGSTETEDPDLVQPSELFAPIPAPSCREAGLRVLVDASSGLYTWVGASDGADGCTRLDLLDASMLEEQAYVCGIPAEVFPFLPGERVSLRRDPLRIEEETGRAKIAHTSTLDLDLRSRIAPGCEAVNACGERYAALEVEPISVSAWLPIASSWSQSSFERLSVSYTERVHIVRALRWFAIDTECVEGGQALGGEVELVRVHEWRM